MWTNATNISYLIVATFYSVDNLVFHFQVAIKLHTQIAHTRWRLNSMTGYCNAYVGRRTVTLMTGYCNVYVGRQTVTLMTGYCDVYVGRQTVTLLHWEEDDRPRFFCYVLTGFLVNQAATSAIHNSTFFSAATVDSSRSTVW